MKTPESVTRPESAVTYRDDYARTGLFEGALGPSRKTGIRALAYVCTDFKTFYALNAETGEGVWSVPMGAEIGLSVISDGVIYIGSGIRSSSDDTKVHALDAWTGESLWSKDCGGRVVCSLAGSASQQLYCGSIGGILSKITAKTGDPVWKVEADNSVLSPVTANAKVAIVGPFAFDTSTGKSVWARPDIKGAYGATVLIESIVYILSSESGLCYALKAESGKRSWETPLPGRIMSGLSANNNYLFCATDKGLHSLELKSGKLNWTAPVKTEGGRVPISPYFNCPVVAGDAIYWLGLDSNLYSLEMSSGNVLWKKEIDGAPGASPPGIANGKLYVGTLKKTIHAIAAESGKEVWRVSVDGQVTGPISIASVEVP